jgi:hypothetical protein
VQPHRRTLALGRLVLPHFAPNDVRVLLPSSALPSRCVWERVQTGILSRSCSEVGTRVTCTADHLITDDFWVAASSELW